MGRVIGKMVLSKCVKYRFKKTLFGKQVLQVADIIQPWDTNTGHDDGPSYEEWRNATSKEAQTLLYGRI